MFPQLASSSLGIRTYREPNGMSVRGKLSLGEYPENTCFFYYHLITRFSAWAENTCFFLSLFPADYPNPERGAGRQVTRASDSRSVLCEKLRFSGRSPYCALEIQVLQWYLANGGVQSLSELPQLPDVAKPATRFYLLRINRLCIMDSAQEYFRSNWKNGGILAGGVSVREAS